MRCGKLVELPFEMGNLIELQHLDIKGTDLIQKMPFGINKLINLQRLSDFVLGEGEGYRIREIGNLSSLRGDFCISRLDNIIKGEDAFEAKLSDKLLIEGLELKWSTGFGDNNKRNEKVEEKVLNFLCPQKEIKTLSIRNYGGFHFSSWIRDPSLNSLSSLKLINCKNCKSLPSIGKLPLLKDVFIGGMDGVTDVGAELFGVNHSNTFASLERFHFDDMPNWKEWDCCEVDEQKVSKFPNLCELSIVNCPQFVGRLPKHLHSLRKLVIRKCEKLVVSVSGLPLLLELEVDECEELIHSEDSNFNSLKSISLSNILNYNIPDERESVVHQICSSLATEQEEVEMFQLEKISGIRSLTMRKCEKFLHKVSTVSHSFTFLSEIYISNCSSLISLSEFKFSPVLKKMVIEYCDNLRCLVNERENMMSSCNTSVLPEQLEIKSCDSLVCLSPTDDVAIRLRFLHIVECTKLICLFSNNKFPIMLKALFIMRCPKLESIGQGFEETSCLESIVIDSSEKMKSLPRGFDKLRHIKFAILRRPITLNVDESWLPRHLRTFGFHICPNFEDFPKSINNFTFPCGLGLICSADKCLPEEGFPIDLTDLSIIAAPKLYRSVVEWGFYKLTSLQELFIGGEGCSDVMSFPEEGITGMMLLPPSLTYIHISQFENLKCISSEGFRNLTSLQELYIRDCPKLTSLPEKCMLLSLGNLRIRDCPLLKREYSSSNKGREWSKIAHIPHVEIDGETIIPRQLD